jgi:hypothetical protein
MAAHRGTITASPAPGLRQPKNAGDQAAFSANCTANRPSGQQAQAAAQGQQ